MLDSWTKTPKVEGISDDDSIVMRTCDSSHRVTAALSVGLDNPNPGPTAGLTESGLGFFSAAGSSAVAFGCCGIVWVTKKPKPRLLRVRRSRNGLDGEL